MKPFSFGTFASLMSGILLAIWTLYWLERRRTPDKKRRIFVTALATISLSFALLFWSWSDLRSGDWASEKVVVPLFFANVLVLLVGSVLSVAFRPRKMSNYCLSAFSLLCIGYWVFMMVYVLAHLFDISVR